MKIRIKRGGEKGLCIMLLLIMGSLFAACGTKEEEKTVAILEQVSEYKGFTRTVGTEEYDLYTYFVKRELPKEASQQELEDRIMEYANEVNATFYLANKLNLCEPFSFDLLKMRMEQENESRKLKKERGEAIYGLESFNLRNFFQYSMDTVEAQLRSYLEGQVDDGIVKEAEEYYESHKEAFQVRQRIVYELTVSGTTKTVTADRDELNFMGDADRGLADFLESAQVEEVFEDVQNEGPRRVVVKEIEYNPEGFGANKEAAVAAYINQELYPLLIQTVAENNPVEIRLEIDE